MKLLASLITILILTGCATKVPFTTKLRNDFNLTDEKLKKVQFYTSETIILERKNSSNQVSTTGESGTLVSSSSSSSERIIIPANRPCIFDTRADDGSVAIRFEMGNGKVLYFDERQNISNGRFYLVANWNNGKGELDYGGSVYYAVRGSAAAYLMVKLKNYKKQMREDRVVKGLKVN